ncbi:uncharacterized protein [Littorina saxatilis]|uniref:uncharacterized protein n=1 Tax=Littorina saxatilis TaxID=31220 RepID=UPI0038B4D88F
MMVVIPRIVQRVRMVRRRDFHITLLAFWTVYSVLLDLCEDKAECQVLAESTTFRQDPCPATSKYLEVHYKCRPNEFEVQTVCEGQQMEVHCKRAMRIAIYSAMFGRAPNGSSDCPPNRPGYIDCQSKDTVSEVRTACQGRKRCDLQAAEDVFGNPCASGINKYLTVTYACVPKNILKELHRHRGRFGPNRKRKKKKKKKKDKGEKQKKGEVTKLTTTREDNSGPTSPSGALSAPRSTSTQVLETYLRTETVDEASTGGTAARERGTDNQGLATSTFVTPRSHPTHVKTHTPAPPFPNPITTERPWFNSDKTSSSSSAGDRFGSNQDWFGTGGEVTGSNRDRDQVGPHRDQGHLDPNGNRNPNGNRDPYSRDRDWDRTSPNRNQGGSNSNWDTAGSRDSSASATNPGEGPPGQGSDTDMSTEATDSGKTSVGSVTDANLTVLCANHTVGAPTVRTLPSNSETPLGVIRELFSVVRFVQGHQEKAILYIVLGVCVGLILLLVVVLGRVCYKLKHNTQAKLDMTEPTHSRNVSHLAHHMNHHHSLLETPMLEHSDSIDRIEVVRFEPRGTLRSGYHSTLHSDSGDRSLNNYYG